MDIVYVGDQSIRIKSKNTSFIVNPTKKVDGEVVILTAQPQDYQAFEGNLVIDGPGEYETAGVSIKADKVNDAISYEFLEDNQSALVVPSVELAKTKETEGYTATVVFAKEGDEDLPAIASEIFAVVGPVPALGEGVKTTDKINLKKTEEYKGFVVNLTK